MIHALELPDFSQTTILVYGDLILDRYWGGISERVSPEAPIPVVKILNQVTRPGGAANVALNLATIHCNVDLMGIIGKDPEADDLKKQLKEKAIQCHFQQSSEISTISKLRVIARNQQMLRLDFEKKLAGYSTEKLIAQYQKNLLKADVVLLSDYAKGTLHNAPQLIAMAREKNIPVLVDPKGNDFGIYSGATLITPNISEFETIVGKCGNNDDLIVEKAKALINRYQFAAMLVTRGKDGMSLIFGDDKAAIHLHSHAREVFDVTGAGDTVIAFLAACTASGLDLERAAYVANMAAGIAVKKLGTAAISLPELRTALRHALGAHQGILTQTELLSIVQDAKAKGEKIVMTNGCFDVIHPGHIQYLEQAKELGDRLIIAVNTDESVKKLKGDSRPINSLESRMAVLSALRVVDWVVPFSEETPEKLITVIKPNVLVKGGDYQVEQIAGHKAVLKNGGQVKILNFYEGHSTTGLIKKIRDEI